MTLPHILIPLALSALTVAATAWEHDPVITTAACVICGLLILLAGGNLKMDWREK